MLPEKSSKTMDASLLQKTKQQLRRAKQNGQYRALN